MVLAAVGQAVLSAAALEQVLLLAILQRRSERDGLDDELAASIVNLSKRTAGHLHSRLKALGIERELTERITDVINRRNQLIHHPVEEPSLLAGLVGSDPAAAVRYATQISDDCDAICRELLPAALEGIFSDSGLTADHVDHLLTTRALSEIQDAETRTKLEKLRRGLGIAADE